MIKRYIAGALALLISAGSASAQVTCSGTWPPVTLTNGTTASATDVMSNFTYLYNCLTGITFPSGGSSTAQGRLTLATATPVMTSAQTGKAVIYYTPYGGTQIPITTNATSFTSTTFSELTNTTTASSVGNAGPAAVVANSNYDLFVWSNSGTLVLTRGPAWTSDTARGAGAGTSELQRVAGIWTNKNAITNGPGANLGTYVGTVRSNASSQIDWNPNPSPAAGGAVAVLGVFNAYNRVLVGASSQDSTPTWSYATTTWRTLNASNSNRITYIDGLAELSFAAALSTYMQTATVHFLGINRDSTTVTPTFTGAAWSNNSTPIAQGTFAPLLGFHYLQAMEADTGGAGQTIFGNSNPASAGVTSQLESFAAAMAL